MPSSEGEWTRRQLLLTGLAAAGYAGAMRPVSATAIATPARGLLEGRIEIPIPAGPPAPAYRARPEAVAGTPPPPLVIVVHEIFGVHEYIRDVCRRLAREGYCAVAPDLFRRHGDVSDLASIGEILELVVSRVRDAEVLADLDAAVAWAESSGEADPARAAVTGFCWGGRVVWLYAAHNSGLSAGVAWYGRLAGAARAETPSHPVDVVGSLRVPVLGLYGSADRGIPPETVRQMREYLSLAGGRSEIVIFPGAPHGFHADYRPSYRALAASEGWRRMLGWLGAHGLPARGAGPATDGNPGGPGDPPDRVPAG